MVYNGALSFGFVFLSQEFFFLLAIPVPLRDLSESEVQLQSEVAFLLIVPVRIFLILSFENFFLNRSLLLSTTAFNDSLVLNLQKFLALSHVRIV